MKSHEKGFPLSVLENIYKDYSRLCGVEEDARDLMKIRSRTKHEGHAFLSLTLPTFGDDFQKSLEIGHIETGMFQYFKKRAGIPLLFGVFLSRVFDSSSALLPEPDPTAIAAIRQLSYTFKKERRECDVEKQINAFKKFEKVEVELASTLVSQRDNDDFSRVCDIIWSNFMPPDDIWRTVPKHGPGATAERISGNRKYDFVRWHDRVEGYFPLVEFGLPNINAVQSLMYAQIRTVDENCEQPVRVIAVPKTAKTPRIIAIEPVCMQFLQQALARYLMGELENRDTLYKGHINFSSQQVNRELAFQASVDRKMATLDLSDASDRVRNDLVIRMLKRYPELSGAIQACRSIRANVPGINDKLKLGKFASMGSALCFPVTSMIYYTCSVLGVLRSRKATIDYASVKSACKSTYVYGDDIIVPANTALEVCATLEAFGLKVNQAKSFWKGFFRESCGMDAYSGTEVTPIYIRRTFPTDRSDSASIVSLVETANQMYKKGLWLTSTFIKKMIERVTGNLPVVGEQSEALGWISYTMKTPNTQEQDMNLMSKFKRSRWNLRYHNVEYLTYVVRPSMKRDPIEGYPALMKFFCEPNPLMWFGVDCGTFRSPRRDMKRSPRFGSVTLKRRWTRPY